VKKAHSLFSIVLLVIVLLMVTAFPVYASPGPGLTMPENFLEWLTNFLLVIVPTLIGVAFLVTVITNILKTVGVISDGNATQWSAGLNLVGIIVLILLRMFKPDWTFEFIDASAGKIANILMILSAYVFQIILSNKIHDGLRGIPVIGKSFTLDSIKAIGTNAFTKTE
jgi:hypothetical protein